jgi:hypothetical protein
MEIDPEALTFFWFWFQWSDLDAAGSPDPAHLEMH